MAIIACTCNDCGNEFEIILRHHKKSEILKIIDRQVCPACGEGDNWYTYPTVRDD